MACIASVLCMQISGPLSDMRKRSGGSEVIITGFSREADQSFLTEPAG